MSKLARHPVRTLHTHAHEKDCDFLRKIPLSLHDVCFFSSLCSLEEEEEGEGTAADLLAQAYTAIERQTRNAPETSTQEREREREREREFLFLTSSDVQESYRSNQKLATERGTSLESDRVRRAANAATINRAQF